MNAEVARLTVNLFERVGKMKSKVMVIGLAMALVLAVGSYASAITAVDVTLTDDDSTVVIDPHGSTGMKTWKIGDTDHLSQQWFWFRTSLGGVYSDREYSIDEISAPSVVQAIPSVAEITYADGNIEAQVTYSLTDVPGLLGGSDLIEIVRVTNNTDEALTLTLIQYSDFDLGGTATDTDLEITNGNTATQKDTAVGALMSETVVSQLHLVSSEVGYWNTTLAKLVDGDVDNLDGTTLLTVDGNMTWAFQWEKELAPGEALLFSKNKHISLKPGGDKPVPEPAGLGLVGIALLALRKRRS